MFRYTLHKRSNYQTVYIIYLLLCLLSHGKPTFPEYEDTYNSASTVLSRLVSFFFGPFHLGHFHNLMKAFYILLVCISPIRRTLGLDGNWWRLTKHPVSACKSPSNCFFSLRSIPPFHSDCSIGMSNSKGDFSIGLVGSKGTRKYSTWRLHFPFANISSVSLVLLCYLQFPATGSQRKRYN